MKIFYERIPIPRFTRKLRLIMRLTVLFVFILSLPSFASSYSQNQKFNFSMEEATIEEIIEHLEQKSEFHFFLKQDKDVLSQKVSVEFRDASITNVLDELLEGTNLTYRIEDQYIAILSSAEAMKAGAQQQVITVKGKVTDDKGEPLPGVSVVEKENPMNGTITGIDGTYSITIASGDGVLNYSFIGFENQELQVVGRTTINITLVDETTGLDEVVVIGYGVQRKSDLTGSVVSF